MVTGIRGVVQIPADGPEEAGATSTPKWRWLLVVLAFIAGAVIYDLVIELGTNNADFYWIGFPLAGFVTVFFPGKIAPSRQLAIALECALLLTAFTVGIMLTVASSWRAGEYSGGATASAIAYLLLVVAGAASALWMVRRKRTGTMPGDLPWAISTGLAIPLVSIGLILVKGFLT